MKQSTQPVSVRREPQVLPTYPLPPASPHPMFFEKRVYQGSSGKVYPLPFHERLSERREAVGWDTVYLENEFVKMEVLPELGGRVQRAVDKTNGYDFFYHQPVIKPALVGLAGPWISGGVEFNWPQHHRPSTTMPTDAHVERHDDGAVTVWLSEHEPMHRMKGMHGLTLRPGSSRIELTGRLYNRTPLTRTFLWWANVAAEVHDQYQSFFPPDVRFVADHAVRAMSSFPVADGSYYGIDYGSANGGTGTDLTWYRNIPVPTSYMVMRTGYDFFGGYDHSVPGGGGGFVHVANRYISPGKKQWTWGHEAFGRAWDRELTDARGDGGHPPYIELMAGVYTDNQPDFTYLLPYETKVFTQSWWPIQGIGVAHAADERFALHLSFGDGMATVGLAAAERHDAVRLVLVGPGGEVVHEVRRDVGPGEPLREKVEVARGAAAEAYGLLVIEGDTVRLRYRPPADAPVTIPPAATEPPMPEAVASADELFLIGEHLDQYRQPTRTPEAYWEEALRRDPGDARCNLALGKRLLDRGLLAEAEEHLRQSIKRYTMKHPNPLDGEPWYLMGLVLDRRQNAEDRADLARSGGDEASIRHYWKATWNRAWRAPSHLRLGVHAMRREGWRDAIGHFDEALANDSHLQHAAVYAAVCHRRMKEYDRAMQRLDAVLASDPLDHFAAFERACLLSDPLDPFAAFKRACLREESDDKTAANDAYFRWDEATRRSRQTVLDIALDYEDADLILEAHRVLGLMGRYFEYRSTVDNHPPRGDDLAWSPADDGLNGRSTESRGSLPQGAMVEYTSAWLRGRWEPDSSEARVERWSAVEVGHSGSFPVRWQEEAVLRSAMLDMPQDAQAPYLLGTFLYDRRRYDEAIEAWETAVERDARHAAAWRCLGIGRFNQEGDPDGAAEAYAKARAAAPQDGRILYEADQLARLRRVAPEERLADLLEHRGLVDERDDLRVELATLLNLAGRHGEALEVLLGGEPFHPWEGGEGKVLTQFRSAHLALGRAALREGDAARAASHFQDALSDPPHLGEARHPLAATADVDYERGRAARLLDEEDAARQHFGAAASAEGDFAEMSVQSFSPMTYYKAMALRELGRGGEAGEVLRRLKGYAERRLDEPATIDYFATSLPDLLVFDADLKERQDAEAWALLAMAEAGLVHTDAARDAVGRSLALDPAGLTASTARRLVEAMHVDDAAAGR